MLASKSRRNRAITRAAKMHEALSRPAPYRFIREYYLEDDEPLTDTDLDVFAQFAHQRWLEQRNEQ